MTGSTGSLGSSLLTALLNDGHSISAISRKDIAVSCDKPVLKMESDIRGLSVDAIDAIAKADCIVHLAAVTGMFDKDVLDVNYQGTMNILNAIPANKSIRFLFVSSTEACGPTGVETVGDDFDGAPVFPYGESKKKAEEALKEYAGKNPQFKYIAVRIGNVVNRAENNLLSELRRMASSRILSRLFGQYELNLVGVEHIAEGLRSITKMDMFSNKVRFMPGIPVSMNILGHGNKQTALSRAAGAFIVKLMKLTGKGGLICYLAGGGIKRPFRRYTMKIYEELGLSAPELASLKG